MSLFLFLSFLFVCSSLFFFWTNFGNPCGFYQLERVLGLCDDLGGKEMERDGCDEDFESYWFVLGFLGKLVVGIGEGSFNWVLDFRN